MKIRLEFFQSPDKLELDCGSYGFDRMPVSEGGPLVVTLVDGDRKDPDANILGVYTGVGRVTVIDHSVYTKIAPAGKHAVAAKPAIILPEITLPEKQ